MFFCFYYFALTVGLHTFYFSYFRCIYTLYLMSDSYLGLDQQYDIHLNVTPASIAAQVKSEVSHSVSNLSLNWGAGGQKLICLQEHQNASKNVSCEDAQVPVANFLSLLQLLHSNRGSDIISLFYSVTAFCSCWCKKQLHMCFNFFRIFLMKLVVWTV